MQWSEILEPWAPLRNNSWERVQRKCPVWHHHRPPGLTCHVHKATIWAILQSLAYWASCFGVITKTTPSQYFTWQSVQIPFYISPNSDAPPPLPHKQRCLFKNQNNEMMSGYVGQDQINISQLCWTGREKGHYVTLIAPMGTIYAQKVTGPLIFIYGQVTSMTEPHHLSFALLLSLSIFFGLPFGPSLSKPGSRSWMTFH